MTVVLERGPWSDPEQVQTGHAFNLYWIDVNQSAGSSAAYTDAVQIVDAAGRELFRVDVSGPALGARENHESTVNVPPLPADVTPPVAIRIWVGYDVNPAGTDGAYSEAPLHVSTAPEAHHAAAPAGAASAAGPAAYPGHPIHPGDHGDTVRAWQEQMEHRGWTIQITGVHDHGSVGVCKEFQAEKGLTADGVIGPKTWEATWNAPVTPRARAGHAAAGHAASGHEPAAGHQAATAPESAGTGHEPAPGQEPAAPAQPLPGLGAPLPVSVAFSSDPTVVEMGDTVTVWATIANIGGETIPRGQVEIVFQESEWTDESGGQRVLGEIALANYDEIPPWETFTASTPSGHLNRTKYGYEVRVSIREVNGTVHGNPFYLQYGADPDADP